VQWLGYGLDDPGFESRQRLEFFSSPDSPNWLQNPPSLQFSGHDGPSLGPKWPALDVDHIPASSAEVTNKWSYTFIPRVCLHGVQKVNFTFTFRQILEEGRGLSDRSGSTGYPSLGGTVAAIIQGRDELRSAGTDGCCGLPP